MSQNPRAVHHIAVGTPEPEQLATFYAERLGLPIIARHSGDDGQLRAAWLRAGTTIVMFERTSAQRDEVVGIGRGPFLLAFAVTEEERANLERQLAEHGHAVESRTTYTSYFRDPDGNRFALSHYPV
jgi:catechol 2,3-dioxygenase-like lactoylglutathione lyase family enzyme